MKKLKVTDIVLDEDLYPRNRIDEFQVRRMTEAFEAGAKFPPLVVEAKTHRLVDGAHRRRVYIDHQIATCEVIEKVYASDHALFEDAIRLNVGHGAALDTYDVKRAVAKLIEWGYEREKIAEVVRLPVPKIEQIEKGFATDSAGNVLPIKGGFSHKRGTKFTDKQVAAMEKYGGHQAAFYANQIVIVLENDLWPRDSEAFAVAMDKIVDMWSAAKKATAA